MGTELRRRAEVQGRSEQRSRRPERKQGSHQGRTVVRCLELLHPHRRAAKSAVGKGRRQDKHRRLAQDVLSNRPHPAIEQGKRPEEVP